MKRAALLLLVLAALAGCGGDDSSDSASSGAGQATVSLDDGLLVDSDGAALYTSEQERSGKVVCTGGCTSIWLPLAAPGSGEPTAGDGVSGKLGTVKRPDGGRQVTLDGRPLYRFAEDTTAGEATGDGVTDKFAGRTFKWHAEGSAQTDSDSGSGGGGGYSY